MKRPVMVIGEVSAGTLFTSLISSPRAYPLGIPSGLRPGPPYPEPLTRYPGPPSLEPVAGFSQIDDPQHKEERHDITRVLEFSHMFQEKYGEEAAREYVQHLADDLNGKFNHLVEDVQVLVDKTLAYFGAKKQ
ncbi:MAG: hypothetical protein WAK57_04635 [Desulfobacterales bacterium]